MHFFGIFCYLTMQVQQNTSTLQCAGVSTRNSRKYESVYRFLDKKKKFGWINVFEPTKTNLESRVPLSQLPNFEKSIKNEDRYYALWLLYRHDVLYGMYTNPERVEAFDTCADLQTFKNAWNKWYCFFYSTEAAQKTATLYFYYDGERL